MTTKDNDIFKLPIGFRKFDRNDPECINDILEAKYYVVLIEGKYPGGQPFYELDVAEAHGTYVDDFWNTYNDWIEGPKENFHVLAYASLNDYWSENPLEKLGGILR